MIEEPMRTRPARPTRFSLRLGRWLRLAAVLTAATSASACDRIEPDVGPVQAGTCDPADSNPDVDISFSRHLVPVLTRADAEGGCSCHNPTSSFRIGVDLGGLSAASYDTLRQGGKNSGRDIIIPGDPCSSILVQKVSPAPPFGSRMPLFGPPFLSQDEQQAIRDWIAEGALNN
jgi:hypothetical protein